MRVYEVPLTLAEHDSDIKINTCTKNSSVICNQALCLLFAQISGERLQDHWSSEKPVGVGLLSGHLL